MKLTMIVNVTAYLCIVTCMHMCTNSGKVICLGVHIYISSGGSRIFKRVGGGA